MGYGYTILETPDMRDYEGLREAYEAALASDHPRTQVGAVINHHWGSNTKVDLRDKHPEDVEWSRVHAEVSALLRAAQHGTITRAHTLYAPWACCTGCAACIIKANVPRVVVHHQLMVLTAPKWQDEVREGVDMLLRNNIRVEAVNKRFGVKIRFDGKEIEV